jgi:hypothetical protein
MGYPAPLYLSVERTGIGISFYLTRAYSNIITNTSSKLELRNEITPSLNNPITQSLLSAHPSCFAALPSRGDNLYPFHGFKPGPTNNLCRPADARNKFVPVPLP